MLLRVCKWKKGQAGIDVSNGRGRDPRTVTSGRIWSAIEDFTDLLLAKSEEGILFIGQEKVPH